MLKKNKKLILILTIMVSYTMITFIDPKLLTTDSGFDSSYDTGSYDSGGYDSGSDYSSYDYNDWDSDTSTSNGGGSNVAYLFCLIVIIIIAVMELQKTKKNKQISTSGNLTEEPSEPLAGQDDKSFEKYFPSLDRAEFLEQRYQDFVKLQIAWMNFDYETLRELLTDELYNQYEMQLETLKLKNEKNKMSDFELESAYIINSFRDQDNINVRINMSVNFYDYIEKDNEIVRGTNLKKIHMKYELIYTKSLENNKSICPNCGAKLKDNTSVKCEYCQTIISQTSNNWALKNKKVINQR